MQDIGISDLDVALIYSIIPFCIFLAPPLVGFVADKLGNYTRVIMIFMVLTGLFHTALLFVPPTITHVSRPNTAVTIRYSVEFATNLREVFTIMETVRASSWLKAPTAFA